MKLSICFCPWVNQAQPQASNRLLCGFRAAKKKIRETLEGQLAGSNATWWARDRRQLVWALRLQRHHSSRGSPPLSSTRSPAFSSMAVTKSIGWNAISLTLPAPRPLSTPVARCPLPNLGSFASLHSGVLARDLPRHWMQTPTSYLLPAFLGASIASNLKSRAGFRLHSYSLLN